MSIHSYLRDKKMTKTALAKAMNVSPAYIAKLLKGKENLTIETSANWRMSSVES